MSDLLFLSTDCSPQAVLVSLTTCVTLSRRSFTSAQIASRVEEALADATFDKMVSPSLTDTLYAAGAVPFFRVVYVLVMMKQYFNQCVNPGGGVFEA